MHAIKDYRVFSDGSMRIRRLNPATGITVVIVAFNSVRPPPIVAATQHFVRKKRG
jgi:hypothetical protein